MTHCRCGDYLLAIVERFQRLVFLAFFYELACQLHEQTTMSIAHTVYCLVKIDIRIIYSTELELVHQVIVHLFRVDTTT